MGFSPGRSYQHSAPVHLNGNIFAAVDVETTGLDPSKHDIIEICILPLNADYSISKAILPFHLRMKPRRPENIDPDAIKINKVNIAEIINTCMDADKVADLLIEWFEKLQLNQGKGICSIAQNYAFDYGFLVDWLGRKTYDYVFARWYRDTMTTALFLNDLADMRNERIPFPKVNLKYLCTTLKVENPAEHTALGDCVATAAVYRKLLGEAYYEVDTAHFHNSANVVDATGSNSQPNSSQDGSERKQESPVPSDKAP